MPGKSPNILVFSSLYPSSARKNAGLFIRERMSKVAQHYPLAVVSPVPWFPLQNVIRIFKPDYRPQPAFREMQDDIQVYFPRFLSIPGLFRFLDGFSMAICSVFLLIRLKKQLQFNIIDAHFAYPDGYAATLLGRWLGVPTSITLRGTEVPLSNIPKLKSRILKALRNADKVFSVSNSLKEYLVGIGAAPEKITVIGNGVDLIKFFPIEKTLARKKLSITEDAEVLISVGGLVNRKGFHRVIEILPKLLKNHPKLLYLIIGGASPEGNNREYLERLVNDLNLSNHVKFLGAMEAKALHEPLSAADVFVLATANEGWANVFLEAMACGLPVVTTDVGGNTEVVCNNTLGYIVPFGNSDSLRIGIDKALSNHWDRDRIIDYAKSNSWDTRIQTLMTEFTKMVN
ncbi:glycosyltransferase [Methylomonas rhizoryzae]|uniref:glycosyltransferase n=1 Tax=Methylomonas rhizoryzae TaxID=2608981 RepID=UPI0012325D7D|nr:glycosyltransferase [Methylomonas rhizoryzae]